MVEKDLLTTSLHDYFDSLVDESLELYDLGSIPATKDYLVTLLCDFTAIPVDALREPLGVLLVETEQVEPKRYVTQLKNVGDRALYLASFFPEQIERRQLDLNYYSDVGGTAYLRLSTALARRQEEQELSDVYAELGGEFRLFVEALADVKKQSTFAEEDVGTLFEEWLSHSHLGAKRRLEKMGLGILTGATREEN